MELSRYLDLYLAESREHLRELNRSLLELEQGGGADAVSRAFRAAHTLKGMSATMGYRRVTDLAHGLEDRLGEIRDGRLEADPGVIDQLLSAADAIEAAVSRVVLAEAAPDGLAAGRAEEAVPDLVRNGAASLPTIDLGPLASTLAEPAAEIPRAGPAPQPVAPPDGTATIVVVVVSPTSPLAAARALIARRNLEGIATVLGSDPEEPGEDFRGEMRIFLAAGADPEKIETAARAAGEIDEVIVAGLRPMRGVAAVAPGRPIGDVAPKSRHVRVDLRRLDELADSIGELSVVGRRLDELVTGGDLTAIAEQLARATSLIDGLRETALAMRMVPIGDVFERFPRLVRDAARALGKEVDFAIEGKENEVDRSVIDAMADPLVHLLRNAVDHGIELPFKRLQVGKPGRGKLTIRAVRERASVRILVEDDGAGVDSSKVAAKARVEGLLAEDDPAPSSGDALLRLLARPGFTTATEVTEVSGRGVGLDVVAASVRAVGGSLELKTERGVGTTFALRLPISLAVAPALRVLVAGESYALPMTHIREAVDLRDVALAKVRGREVIRLRGEAIPLVRLSRLLRCPGEQKREAAAVIAEVGERRAALAVDELVAREQVVVKPFDAAAGMLPYFSGVTLLADGRPALVLDPMTVL